MQHNTNTQTSIRQLQSIRLLFIFILLAGVPGWFSCTKSNSGSNGTPILTDSVDIYIAGTGYPTAAITDFSTAEIWKNGKLTKIPNSGISNYVSGIYVSNNDVYLSGYELTGLSLFVPKYWKNGVPVTIKDTMSITTGIAVSNNDVYVIGSSTDPLSSKSVARYWKNGIGVKLSDGTRNTYASGIFISNGEVFIVGNEDSVMKLWVNGANRNISSAPVIGYATSIYVTGNDVYIAGNEYDQSHTKLFATYWKNGNAVALSSGLTYSTANSIVVSGNDVYTAGLESVSAPGAWAARYWKNTNQINLTDGASQLGIANAIAVEGKNVYVAGSEGGVGRYWLNGKAVNLAVGGGGGDGIYGIAISKR